jgi:hypothetical protein
LAVRYYRERRDEMREDTHEGEILPIRWIITGRISASGFSGPSKILSSHNAPLMIGDERNCAASAQVHS